MFAGHLAVAFGAKRAAPRVSLGTLVAASYGLDLLWPPLLLVGVEHVRIEPGITAFGPLDFVDYPWSHSLLLSLVWGLLAGAAYWAVRRGGRGALVVGLLVPSHWLLDWVTHRPDLPLWPAGPKVGLGLWNSVAGTLVAEGALFVGCTAIYVLATRRRDRVGRWALAGLVAFVGLIWVSQPWSPPPPSWQAVAWVGIALWLLPFWAAWIDRHRDPRLS